MKVNKGPLRWWFPHCYKVWGAPNSCHIHLVVKAPSICDHSKSCEETLRKAMEGMEYSWKLPGGFPMCRQVSFFDDDLQSLPRHCRDLSDRSLWLQIIAEANLKFDFREYDNMFPLCKMLELNFGWQLPAGLLYYLIFLLPRSQRSQNRLLASWCIFPWSHWLYLSLAIFCSAVDGCLFQVAITCNRLHWMFCTDWGYDKFWQQCCRQPT